MPYRYFENKIALITGASSGIGAHTAILLAMQGIHVILTARRNDRLQTIEKTIKDNNGKVSIYQADLADEDDRRNLFSTLSQAGLSPDILINNAGIAWYGYYSEMPWPVALNIIRVNIEAASHMTSLFLPAMLQRKWGRIINIGSIAGKLPEQGIAVYSGSKAFLDAFTTSIYRDLRGSGVTASVLRAGPVRTEFFDVARNQKNGGTVPAEKLAISANRVARAVMGLIRHPRRVRYVPFYMALSPMLETCFSLVIDQLGPLLLRHRKTSK